MNGPLPDLAPRVAELEKALTQAVAELNEAANVIAPLLPATADIFRRAAERHKKLLA